MLLFLGKQSRIVDFRELRIEKEEPSMEESGITRRRFIERCVQTTAGIGLGLAASGLMAQKDEGVGEYKISLAGWSLHRRFFEGKFKLIDFPKVARQEFGIEAIELVNTFFPSPTYSFLQDLNRTAANENVKILLIMCDAEGDMADTNEKERLQAVLNHHKWVDIACVLGSHSIRCNSGRGGAGDEEAIKRCADSFQRLVEYAAPKKINVIIENHGGLSSDPDSLIKVMKLVDSPFFGTLPDFGNFPKEVDKYDAVRRMMPYAKAVSAKCYDFGEDGNERTIDYAKMMRVVTGAGYHSYVGIEYEGSRLSEAEGVLAAKKLMERLQSK
jgi:L-ribulose-5-phosphate 3-epimerase